MGNKKLNISNTTSTDLIKLRAHYNVNLLDPENLKSMHGELIARFTLKYLRLMFEENNSRYSKNNPGIAQTTVFINELIKRYQVDTHIQSFGIFYDILHHI